jgi:hypothetical protein
MRRTATWFVGLMACATVSLSAQVTGMPSFNAPYRAFNRSELGVALSFPNGAGTAIEGAYRYASGKLDVGFRGGIWDPGSCCKTELLAGIEARDRVITHTADFPLDGALVIGAGGAFVSGGSAVFLPVGLSLGRRIEPKGSHISIVPYVEPTATIVGSHGTTVDFTLGFGADFRLTHMFDARVSFGIGDLDGVSIGATWVH